MDDQSRKMVIKKPVCVSHMYFSLSLFFAKKSKVKHRPKNIVSKRCGTRAQWMSLFKRVCMGAQGSQRQNSDWQSNLSRGLSQIFR